MEKTVTVQIKEFLNQKLETLKKVYPSVPEKSDSQEGRFYSAYSPEALKLSVDSFQSVLTEIERLEKENPSVEDTLNSTFDSFAEGVTSLHENLTKVAKEGYKDLHSKMEKTFSEIFKATKVE